LTPYPELDSVLKEHAERLKEALGGNFVGCYLQGSLAIGGFDQSSDVDFIVVTNTDLTSNDVEKVQAAHLMTHEQDNRWAKRLEYAFFAKDKLRMPASPCNESSPDSFADGPLWFFNKGGRTIQKIDEFNLGMTRWILREKGIPIIGLDLKTLVDPVTVHGLRREIRNTLVGWGKKLLENSADYQNRFFQSYLVLNYCRFLHDLSEGRIESKLAGVKWAKVHLDPQWIELIDFCWNERRDATISTAQPANPEVFAKSLKFVAYAVDKGRRYPISPD
jgi:hypothetical protein